MLTTGRHCAQAAPTNARVWCFVPWQLLPLLALFVFYLSCALIVQFCVRPLWLPVHSPPHPGGVTADVRERAAAAVEMAHDAQVHGAEGCLSRTKHQSSVSAHVFDLEQLS